MNMFEMNGFKIKCSFGLRILQSMSWVVYFDGDSAIVELLLNLLI